MFGNTIGPGEILIVLVIALLIFGPKKLPELGKGLGRGMRDFKRAVSGDDEDERREEESKKAEIPAPPVVTAPAPAPAPVVAEPVVAAAPVPPVVDALPVEPQAAAPAEAAGSAADDAR